jgi:hypothetical protein
MKKQFFKIFSTGCALLAGLIIVPLQAQAVNISIGVGGEVAPGVYGSVNIDNNYEPVLVYDEPLIVTRPSRILAPVYLHVPPKHMKKWGRYCRNYGACGRPVYFVRSNDYYDFSPRYIEQRYVYRDYGHHRESYRKDYHRDHDKRGHKHGHDKHRDKDKDRHSY